MAMQAQTAMNLDGARDSEAKRKERSRVAKTTDLNNLDFTFLWE